VIEEKNHQKNQDQDQDTEIEENLLTVENIDPGRGVENPLERVQEETEAGLEENLREEGEHLWLQKIEN